MRGRSPEEALGILSKLWARIRLAWRLLRDRRVPLWTKILIPGVALAYVLFPFDVLPDLTPFIGQLDDLALAALAIQAFVSACPRNLVEEHLRRLSGVAQPPSEEEVVDGEFVVKTD